MHNYRGKLVELPRKGKLLVITDIHGNLKDYQKFMKIWDKSSNGDNHLVLTGDFIHAMGKKKDQSIEVLESVKSRWEKSSNFHVLLGNHEWATVSQTCIYKAGVDQNLNFENLLHEKFGDRCERKLEEYTEFFKKLPIAVKTGNKVFISHAGPPRDISSIDEIVNITAGGYLGNAKLFQILWNRSPDYNQKDLESFLKTVGCKVLIVGHTPVDGVKLVGENLLIVSSSYSKGKKAYVELDLENEIKNGKDVLKMVKYVS